MVEWRLIKWFNIKETNFGYKKKIITEIITYKLLIGFLKGQEFTAEGLAQW